MVAVDGSGSECEEEHCTHVADFVFTSHQAFVPGPSAVLHWQQVPGQRSAIKRGGRIELLSEESGPIPMAGSRYGRFANGANNLG